MQRQGMIATMKSLTGNARACVLTEPLWGIPYYLCMAYASPYMAELGVSESQIGLIGTIYLIVAVIASFLSGLLTDKFGRRWTTFLCDLFIWSIPELLWAFSQNFAWFLVAAVLNGFMRITANSWGLLLVEDSDDEMVLKCNSLAQLMGLVSVVVMPFSGLAVGRFGLVPTMRVLYFLGFVLMTTKFIVLNCMAHETSIGVQRMKETKDQSILSMLLGCKDVYLHLLRDKRILLTMAMIAMFQIVSRLNEYFMSLYAIGSIGISKADWVWFAFVKSLITCACILIIMPRIRLSGFKRPLLWAWSIFILSQLLLMLAPGGAMGIAMLALCAVCEGIALFLISPIIDTMLVINADPALRARIYGLVYGTILLGAALFPWIAGVLSGITSRAPFVINVLAMCGAMALTVALSRARQEKEGAA